MATVNRLRAVPSGAPYATIRRVDVAAVHERDSHDQVVTDEQVRPPGERHGPPPAPPMMIHGPGAEQIEQLRTTPEGTYSR